MREARSALAAAAVLLFAACDIEMPNPGPPGEPPSTGEPVPVAAGGGPAGGAADPGAPPVQGSPDAGAPSPTPPPGGGAPPPAAPATHTVNVSQMQFIDAKGGTTTTVKVGDSVKWVNSDSMDHTATADNGSFNGALAQGATYTWTFHTAGSYPYHCNKHQSTMKGTVIVQP